MMKTTNNQNIIMNMKIRQKNYINPFYSLILSFFPPQQDKTANQSTPQTTLKLLKCSGCQPRLHKSHQIYPTQKLMTELQALLQSGRSLKQLNYQQRKQENQIRTLSMSFPRGLELKHQLTGSKLQVCLLLNLRVLIRVHVIRSIIFLPILSKSGPTAKVLRKLQIDRDSIQPLIYL